MPTWATRTVFSPDNDVVRDMHQIIGLNPPADKGFAERSPVNGVIGPDFNIVIDLNDARVGNFVIALAVGSITKAVTADHRTGMNDSLDRR